MHHFTYECLGTPSKQAQALLASYASVFVARAMATEQALGSSGLGPQNPPDLRILGREIWLQPLEAPENANVSAGVTPEQLIRCGTSPI